MSLPFTILLALVFSILPPYFVSLTHSKVARLGISPTTRPTDTVDASAGNSDLKFFYYDQNLDHFTFTPESYQTFQQRYAIDSKHWAGAKANAPILAFLGEEASLEVDLHDHRYYGKSMPFGSAEEALKNASTLGYLNAAQALADYAAILLHVKEKYSAKHSPIIVVGASYGGRLVRTRLSRSFDIKDFLDSIYAESVQFNGNPGVVAYIGNQSCYDTDLFIEPSNDIIAWSWQACKLWGCSEIVMPIGHDKHDTMFQTAPFNMTNFIDDCKSNYGVSPRPHWITTYFGIQVDVKLILRRFGSNIIFSNGLADPYSVGGVLENVSGSVVAIKTLNGTHSQDLSTRRKDDPEWLVMQREKEIKIIESWISTYQKDLRGLNMS
ncbi:hypothetical protein Bca101_025489 [Brassica carinata]